MSRQKAYAINQSAAMKVWNSNVKFEDILNKNKEFNKYISSKDLKKIFSNNKLNHIDTIFQRTFEN